MAMLGMDPDVVENIGNQMKNQATQVQQVMSAVDGLVSQAEANWKGTDSDQFRDTWMSQYKPVLNQMFTALEQLGTTAIQNAASQRATSQV